MHKKSRKEKMKLNPFKKGIYLFLVTLGVSFFATLTLAGGIEMPSNNGAFFSVFGGVNFETSGATTSVDLGSLVTNLYVANTNSTTTGSIVGADAGYLWLFYHRSL